MLTHLADAGDNQVIAFHIYLCTEDSLMYGWCKKFILESSSQKCRN